MVKSLVDSSNVLKVNKYPKTLLKPTESELCNINHVHEIYLNKNMELYHNCEAITTLKHDVT